MCNQGKPNNSTQSLTLDKGPLDPTHQLVQCFNALPVAPKNARSESVTKQSLHDRASNKCSARWMPPAQPHSLAKLLHCVRTACILCT